MNDAEIRIRHYVSELAGPNPEDAFHRLLEEGSSALPTLALALAEARSPRVGAQLVELIWQTREPAVVKELTAALADPSREVWQVALDGLVSIGGPAARATIQAALAASTAAKHGVPSEWLEEALDQIDTREGNEAV